jgi:hypothetical protein
MDEKRVITNDLYIIDTCKTSLKFISSLSNFFIAKKPWKNVKVETIGVPPSQRYGHSAEFIVSQAYLLIYGGRNYDLYEVANITCLGDIFILNLTYMVWCNVRIISGESIERYNFMSYQTG